MSSPDWRDQIIYFLMTDRFNDGDVSNNDLGLGEFNPTKESHYNGGDLQGVIDKLDYIQRLGATAVWMTPPVKNLWWSEASQYAGYHGYWARDFKSIDPHIGTLEDYQRLSKSLHQRDMYLIQDIVINHSAPLFTYKGGYDPDNTRQNFTLLGDKADIFPTQTPFDKADRLNHKHAQANIYNWTPSINDYNSYEQQSRYQLGNLADINTRSPEVLKAFKESYRYWMKEAGVDAFRVDTAKYVDHDFWQHFFHDEDGIQAQARELGKSHFLTFAEVFAFSEPYQDNGEQNLRSYLGSKSTPEFNSVINFPLYQSINKVLAEGQPSKQLAYRLEQHMHYPDPFTVVNFVDNHDVKRFLSAASIANFKQALSVIFTIPGIPVIYQGSEQAHKEARQAMFSGGYLAESDQFDTTSEMFVFIQSLAELRKRYRVLSRGHLTLLDANEYGAGLLAYRRDYQGQTALILMNIAPHSILVEGLSISAQKQRIKEKNDASLNSLHLVFSEQLDSPPSLNKAGELNVVLPANAIALLVTNVAPDDAGAKPISVIQTDSALSDVIVELDNHISGEVYTQDIEISGSITTGKETLKAIINGNLDKAITLHSDENGRFGFVFPVRNLGESQYTLQFYAPRYQITSSIQQFTTRVQKPEYGVVVEDKANDAHGPTGQYKSPQHENSAGQREILKADAKAAGGNLILTLDMQKVTNVWGAANGFDNVAFSVYFNFPKALAGPIQSAKVLPYLNASMPHDLTWSLGHIIFGWGNSLFTPNLSLPQEKGDKLGMAPEVNVDYQKQQIQFIYHGDSFGVSSWQGVQFYVATWDMTGEGTFRELLPEVGPWHFGGATAQSPKIMDDILLRF
ncbi:alpha-amylase family glycosyl hydrolase [Alteromonas sp. a30]|uniref:alpha-amylase family glycosyl hydrolase n=1 Tax=Alteromonas sp. a30 TaxID=2730917 RepID=UPI00228184AF|nr:alpha-amylase family glycosyl hydrolase [Alteromonas sp. a30]